MELGSSTTGDADPAIAFSAELWSGIVGIYAAILEHPFVTGLTDGSLQRGAFEFYVIQDAHYLREYARALSIAAARAPAEADIAMFNEHAAGAIAVERSLHESFLAEFGLTERDVARTPLAPTNLSYTSYLLATAHGGSFAELVGALLPCYWIYSEVGKALLRAVIALTDRLGPELSPAQRARVAHRFRVTSRYEWMFWEMGYRGERWPEFE